MVVSKHLIKRAKSKEYHESDGTTTTDVCCQRHRSFSGCNRAAWGALAREEREKRRPCKKDITTRNRDGPPCLSVLTPPPVFSLFFVTDRILFPLPISPLAH